MTEISVANLILNLLIEKKTLNQNVAHNFKSKFGAIDDSKLRCKKCNSKPS